MKSHCIYGSDDCTKCKVAPEDGLRRDTLKEDFRKLTGRFLSECVYLENLPEGFRGQEPTFLNFTRWLDK